MAYRLFAALHPPAAVRDQLLDTMGGVPGARWQAEEQLHLTVRFIGEVDGAQAEDVALALGQVHAAAPTIRLAGTGRFAHRGRTEALWAAVAPHDALHALHRKVDAACVRAGLEPERRAYLPHVTLARFGRDGGRGPEVERWLADTAGLASPPFTPAHLLLYRSHLGREGATYEAVARWPLVTP